MSDLNFWSLVWTSSSSSSETWSSLSAICCAESFLALIRILFFRASGEGMNSIDGVTCGTTRASPKVSFMILAITCCWGTEQ